MAQQLNDWDLVDVVKNVVDDAFNNWGWWNITKRRSVVDNIIAMEKKIQMPHYKTKVRETIEKHQRMYSLYLDRKRGQ